MVDPDTRMVDAQIDRWDRQREEGHRQRQEDQALEQVPDLPQDELAREGTGDGQWSDMRTSLESYLAKMNCQNTSETPPLPPPEGCICNGAGFYKLPVSYWHADFGKMFPCICRLRKRREQAQAVQEARLNELDAELLRYRECHLDNYDLDRAIRGPLTWNERTLDVKAQRASLREAHRIVTEYAANPGSRWLYVYGPPGGGKTHLAVAIANARRERGERPVYGACGALLDYIRSGINTNTALARTQSLASASLVVLDELEVNLTTWEQRTIGGILARRYDQQLPTVITSNYWRDELPSHIADRIAGEATVVWVLAESFRRLGGK